MAERHPGIVSIGHNVPRGSWHIGSHSHNLLSFINLLANMRYRAPARQSQIKMT